MAMDGFITGLANTLKEGVDQRRQKADEYYEKQLEMARTTGLRNMKEAQGRVHGSIAFANKLTQKGVPKDIIMAVAQSNPDGLGDFEETITKMELDKGGRITEQEYRDLVKIKGEMVGKDKDLVTFFKDMHDPFIASTKDKEMHDYDPRGSILSRMFAVDAMDRADKRLDDKVIAGGKTAAELLQYGDEYLAQPSTSLSVDFDPATVDTMARSAAARKKALSGDGGYSINELNTSTELSQKLVNDATTALTSAMKGAELQTPEQINALQDKVLEDVIANAGIDKLDNPDLRDLLKSQVIERVERQKMLQESGVEAAPAEEVAPEVPKPNTRLSVTNGTQQIDLDFVRMDEAGNYLFRDVATGKLNRIKPETYQRMRGQ